MFGLSIAAYEVAKTGVREASTVREDVHGCGIRFRQRAAASMRALAVEGRLAAGEADVARSRRKQPDELECVLEEPVIVCALRRLGAHQAEVVAALGQKNTVLAALVPPQNSDLLPGRRRPT